MEPHSKKINKFNKTPTKKQQKTPMNHSHDKCEILMVYVGQVYSLNNLSCTTTTVVLKFILFTLIIDEIITCNKAH